MKSEEKALVDDHDEKEVVENFDIVYYKMSFLEKSDIRLRLIIEESGTIKLSHDYTQAKKPHLSFGILDITINLPKINELSVPELGRFC